MSRDAAAPAEAGVAHFEHDTSAQLVKMANAIGSFFHGEPDREAALAGISNHIDKFWTKRMRKKLAAYIQGGGVELTDLTREAFLRLKPA
jgi:formate dehydrogenase subunit delta